MKDNVFWDTNLWIYRLVQSQDAEDQRKHGIVSNLLLTLLPIVISVQVLNETCNVLLKKHAVAPTNLAPIIRSMINLAVVKPLDSSHTLKALDLMDQYKLQWFDALIVAVALKSDCKTLYSEDMHHELHIDQQLTIINPFL